MKRLLFTIFVAFLFLSICFSNAYAQSLDVSIYPPITEIIITPGTNVRVPIMLTNLANELQKISPSFKPFQAVSDDGTVKLMDEKAIDPIRSMIRLEKEGEPVDEIMLRPSETAHLELAVTVRKEASLSEHIRDHYLTILFQTVHEREIKQSASRIEAAIGSIVLLSIRDPAIPEMPNVRLKDFSTQGLFTGGPISFSLLIENQSSHFIKAKGEIRVYDVNGRVIEKITLPWQNVLAASTRNLSSQGSMIESEKLFGRYKAEAQVDIGEDKVLYERLTFYVVPKKIGIISLIILFAFAALILRFHSYLQSLIPKKQKTSYRLPRLKSKRKIHLSR